MSHGASKPLSEIYNMPAPVAAPPQRVVSLVPSITESLFDLQLGSRLVGVTNYCIHPEDGVAKLPRVGGTKNPNIQKIIALKPDLVIMNREENRLEDAQALREAGIPVWATHPQTVQDAINLLWEIMYVFDEPVMVERVRWIERQMDWVANAAKANRPVRVFVPIWYKPWMTFNSQTYIHDLLRTCGGENVFGHYRLQAASSDAGQNTQEQENRYPCITLEDIIAARPEVILLPDEPFAFTADHVRELSKLDIPAARQQRIHLVDGSLLTWHGTRLAYALAEIPPLLAAQP